MDDEAHNEDKNYNHMAHASLDSAKSLFEKVTGSRGFASQRFSQLVSASESFTNS